MYPSTYIYFHIKIEITLVKDGLFHGMCTKMGVCQYELMIDSDILVSFIQIYSSDYMGMNVLLKFSVCLLLIKHTYTRLFVFKT